MGGLPAKTKTNILMVGLDAAGKTTILYRLDGIEGAQHRREHAYWLNIERLSFKHVDICCWDVGGTDKIDPAYRAFYKGRNCIVFVVDSNDRDRISGGSHTSHSELMRLLGEEGLKGLPLLVYANKLDLPNCMSVIEVTEQLRLHDIKDRPWYIQGACAPEGDGIWEGLDWLTDNVDPRKRAEWERRTRVDRRVVNALRLVAPCIAFVIHNKDSPLVDCIDPLLPVVYRFAGAIVPGDVDLSDFWRTQYFLRIKGCGS